MTDDECRITTSRQVQVGQAYRTGPTGTWRAVTTDRIRHLGTLEPFWVQVKPAMTATVMKKIAIRDTLGEYVLNPQGERRQVRSIQYALSRMDGPMQPATPQWYICLEGGQSHPVTRGQILVDVVDLVWSVR